MIRLAAIVAAIAFVALLVLIEWAIEAREGRRAEREAEARRAAPSEDVPVNPPTEDRA